MPNLLPTRDAARPQKNVGLGLILTALGIAVLGVSFPAAAQPGQQKLYAYSSAGDNQWVSDWPPIDSAATVRALFEWYAKTYNVKRMYWRGEQDRMWLQHYRFRREIPLYYEFWTEWLRYLSDEVKTDDLAVAAAHRQGMQIYIFDGLFEHATQGDAGGCGMFPYQCEDKLRQEHPEWCPVDRWGERVCPGPIEFCYPEARKALVARYLRHVTKYGYDGIGFYTYVENYGLRYLDEYGFNEPIVKEFKRRYGVDIRTEAFDKEAWGKLRGEYLTQFLRELHTALTKRGKKLCFTLRGDKPNLPQRWLGLTTDFPGAGRVHHDWETWVKEGLVDELMVWFGSAPEDKQKLAKRIRELAGGKPIEVTIADSSPFDAQWKPFIEEGVALVTVTAPGYGADRFSLEPTSMETLKSHDWKLRAQTLADVAAGKLKTDSATVATLVSDPHVLVRREAIRSLAALTATEQVPLIEAALTDAESSV
ncbi:MAG: hypothetical protein HY318_06685, partial [Armatimonadetes bacterium]|nr:hypothetical protein [Armatimonadota bacterium]